MTEQERPEPLPEHSLAADLASFLAALAELGRGIVEVGRAFRVGAQLVELDRRVDVTARALGLTPEQGREVAEAWYAWARRRGFPRPAGAIRHALVSRAMGDEWHPREDTVDGLPPSHFDPLTARELSTWTDPLKPGRPDADT